MSKLVNLVQILDDGSMNVPVTMFADWSSPGYIEFYRSDLPGSGYTIRALPAASSNLLQILNSLHHSSKSRFRRSTFLRLSSIDYNSQTAFFSSIVGNSLRPGLFSVANYCPHYELIPIDKLEERGSGNSDHCRKIKLLNYSFWSSVRGYHEHLAPSDQQVEAHAVSRLIAETMSVFENFSGRSILELGCGAGRNLLHLSNIFEDNLFYGVDANDAMLSQQKSSNVHFSRENVLDWKWASRKYDIIFTSGFLMHINHQSVRELLARIHDCCTLHFHYELHGASHDWDCHRYPRCYKALFHSLNIPFDLYRLYPNHESFGKGLSSGFCHSLILSRLGMGSAPLV